MGATLEDAARTAGATTTDEPTPLVGGHLGLAPTPPLLPAAWGSTDAPMGGFKDSGLGRRHGREGILEYTEVQTIAVQRGFPVDTVPMLGQEATARVLTGALTALHATRRLSRR